MVYLTPHISVMIKKIAVTYVRETSEGGGVPCHVTPELILLAQIQTFAQTIQYSTVQYICYCTEFLGEAPPLYFK